MQFFPENFAHGFQENQLVIPIRLHHVTGHPVHHGRHFRNRRKEDERTLRKRLRRELRFVRKTSAQNNDLRESANPSSRADETNRTLTDVIPQEFSGDDEESGEDYVDENEMHLDHKFANFSVTAFGEEFRLHLTPYDEFLAPNYTLHYMGDAEKEGFRGAEWDVPRHCFYSGHVNGRPDHRAVLSVCRGLVSTLWVHCSCKQNGLRELNAQCVLKLSRDFIAWLDLVISLFTFPQLAKNNFETISGYLQLHWKHFCVVVHNLHRWFPTFVGLWHLAEELNILRLPGGKPTPSFHRGLNEIF